MAKTVRITKTVEFGSSISSSDTIALTVASPGTINTPSVTVQDIEDGDLDVIVSDDVTQITATISSGTCTGESTTINITDNTVSPTPSISVTPEASSIPSTPPPTGTPGASQTPSISTTPSISVTPSISTTPGDSATPTPSNTPSVSVTPSISKTPSVSVTPSISKTPSVSVTPSISKTPSISVTPSRTPSTSVALYYRFENCDTSELVFQQFASAPTIGDRYTDGSDFFIRDSSNGTSLPGTVVTNLTYAGTTGCPPATPPASTQPQTLKAQITNCGGSTTYFVEFTNHSTLPEGFAIESSQINLDGQCWQIIDNEYPGPIDFSTTTDNVYSSCASCLPPTPTPSVTRTPSASEVFYSFTTVFSSVSEFAACEVVSPTGTVYSTCSTITVGCRLYDSTSIFDYAADGWYHDINNGNYYYVEGNGYVAETGACSTPAPSTTPQASSTPCTAFLLQEFGSATSSAACSGASATTTRGHNGLGTHPEIGDTIYARDTCGATFDGGNLWYFVGVDTAAIFIDNSGTVVNKVNC